MSHHTSAQLETIAQLLESLPSQALRNQAKTCEQLEEWDKFRANQILIAQGWRSQYLIRSYYPLEEAVDNNMISECKAELIRCRVREYKACWELCQVAEPFVKEVHRNLQTIAQLPLLNQWPPWWQKFFAGISQREYPFTSAQELFAEIIRDEIDGTFSICLQRYYEVPMKKWRQLIGLYKNLLKQSSDGSYPILNPTKQEKLKHQLVWDKVSFSWMGMMLWVCQFKGRHCPLLQYRLKQYHQAAGKSLKLTFTASRGMKGWGWRDGKLMSTTSKGGIYI